jgi:DNA-binding PadR family transcriptional regulator
MPELTKLEEQILLSVWRLQDEAYGISIYENIRNITKKNIAVGGIYFPLERLVKRGYLKAVKGEPSPVRGGQSKRYYRLTPFGVKELLKAKKTQEAFWRDLPGLKYIKKEVK